MTFRDAVWLDAEHTMCDLIVTKKGVDYPYTYVIGDTSPTSKKIAAALADGSLIPSDPN